MTKLKLRRLDGIRHEIETATWLCLADRIAFERRYGRSAIAEIEALQGAVDPERQTLREGADLSPLREESIAFFAWRAAARSNVGDYAGMAFETWLELVADLDIEERGEGAEANPTEPVALSGI